jgi:hypothetical protein
VTRHAVKLALLIPGLVFLGWWGWSGNFAFNKGDLYRLVDQERFYVLSLGGQPVGWARRAVDIDADGGRTVLSEETVLELSPGLGTIKVKTISSTVFDDRGRLVSAEFRVPLGDSEASATARAVGSRLECRLAIGERVKEASLRLPPSGPVVVSGVVPWLGHQRDLPMGRPLAVDLLDPVAMSFKPAELTIEDDTAEAEEIQTFKLTLRFMSAESVERVDSTGLLVSQYNPALESGLTLAGDEEAEAARAALAAPPTPLPAGLIGDLVDQVLSGGGLEALSGLMGS